MEESSFHFAVIFIYSPLQVHHLGNLYELNLYKHIYVYIGNLLSCTSALKLQQHKMHVVHCHWNLHSADCVRNVRMSSCLFLICFKYFFFTLLVLQLHGHRLENWSATFLCYLSLRIPRQSIKLIPLWSRDNLKRFPRLLRYSVGQCQSWTLCLTFNISGQGYRAVCTCHVRNALK